MSTKGWNSLKPITTPDQMSAFDYISKFNRYDMNVSKVMAD